MDYKEFFKNKTIPTLKLWGRALTRLRHDAALRLAWTTVVREDFLACGASDDSLHEIISELVANAPEAEFSFLLYETETPTGKQISGWLRSGAGLDARELLLPFHPVGTPRQARFQIEAATILQAEEQLLEHLRIKIPKLKKG